eukprot:GABV01000675.1.p1 GENE.GABV01000675.1~~GABV01000675.1.p1  ORF type:complete len:183 (-),score=66.92 GABV01000675.1:626-1138(-)
MELMVEAFQELQDERKELAAANVQLEEAVKREHETNLDRTREIEKLETEKATLLQALQDRERELKEAKDEHAHRVEDYKAIAAQAETETQELTRKRDQLTEELSKRVILSPNAARKLKPKTSNSTKRLTPWLALNKNLINCARNFTPPKSSSPRKKLRWPISKRPCPKKN